MLEISKIDVYPLELPLKEAFETAKGRKTSSPAVIVELRLSNGLVGLGSATPVAYVTGEDTTSVLSAINACASDLHGCVASAYMPLFRILAEVLPYDHSARAALEMAVLDAFCKLHDISMYAFFGGLTPEVETDVTVPIVPPETARELAEEASARGFNYLKVKVGSGSLDEDLERVIAASKAAPRCGIRVDANQAFVPAAALGFISKLSSADVHVDMLEQPVDRNDLDGLRYVTQHTSMPVFADESVVTPADALKLIKLEAVDGINVKLMKSGISGALEIIALCKVAGKEIMLGSMIETDVGLSAAVHLACGTGAFSRIDLDSHLLVSSDEKPFSGGFTHHGPILAVDKGALGHGIASERAKEA